MNDLIIYHPINPLAALIRPDGSKDANSRLRQFIDWQAGRGQSWAAPDLASYRDTMRASGKAESTIHAHLASVRSAYSALLQSNDVRQALFESTPADLSPADRFAMVNEAITRIQNATAASAAPVKLVKKQDESDSDHLRLTAAQAGALLSRPGVTTLQGLRDTALIAVMLCTGIREAELCGLAVDDLRQRLGGELALRVTEGKGKKSRLVPYGDLDWCLVVVDHWLRAAGIASGAVFRGFHKPRSDGSLRVRSGRLSVRAVQYILAAYPISIGGSLRAVKPHDLRRTYARLQFEAGLEPVALQQNLGHSDLKTTLHYVGTLDGSKRRARAALHFDLTALQAQSKIA
jgi:site-specific recombinase XerD